MVHIVTLCVCVCVCVCVQVLLNMCIRSCSSIHSVCVDTALWGQCSRTALTGIYCWTDYWSCHATGGKRDTGKVEVVGEEDGGKEREGEEETGDGGREEEEWEEVLKQVRHDGGEREGHEGR